MGTDGGVKVIVGILSSQITIQKTATPFILDMTTGPTYRYQVKNLDADTATIYSIHDNPNPTTSRGSIASNSNTTTINTMVSAFLGSSITIYAKAQASGKTMSDVEFLYLEK